MSRRRRRAPSPAMVVALIALVMGATGGALAGTLITGAQVRDGSLTGADVRNRSLGLVDLKAAAVRALRGAQGPAGAAGAQGAQGPQGPAGAPGAALFGGPLPAGTTVTGAWGAIVGDVGAGQETAGLESFPVRAPVPLAEENVSFGVNGPAGAPSAQIAQAVRAPDEDAACTGRFAAPTAPPGKLCVYVREEVLLNVAAGSLGVFALDLAPSPAGVHGFLWIFEAAVPAPSGMRAEGTWAYTAPL